MRKIGALLTLVVSFTLYAQAGGDRAAIQHQKHNLNVLPAVMSAYEALAPLDSAQRRSVIQAMTPGMRAGIWRAHLVLFVEDHPELTASQRDAVNAISRMLTPAVFDTAAERELDRQAAKVELDRAMDDAKQVLPAAMISSLAYRAGPPQSDVLTLSPGSRLKARSDIENCSCAGDDPLDPCWAACFHDRLCRFTQDGCGEFGLDPCGSICHAP